MGSLVEVNISDEKLDVLKELAKQRGLSLKTLCEKIVLNCLCRYRKEKHPLPDIDISALIKSDQDFFARLYAESLKEERIKNSRANDNIIELAKPADRLDR